MLGQRYHHAIPQAQILTAMYNAHITTNVGPKHSMKLKKMKTGMRNNRH